MSCESIQSRLQHFLDGKLGGEARAAIELHLAGCADCRELATLMRVEPGVQATPDLASSVLARTTGSACDRAEEIVCDFVDGRLGSLDCELIEQHVESCEGCASLATALARLGSDLPAMAELTPPAELLEGVLAATTHRPRRWADLAERLERGWAALLARPRLAWETGYVGAMSIWLVFSLVGADLKASMRLPSGEATTKVVGSATAGVESLGRQAWETTGGWGVDAWQSVQTDFDERYRRTEPARDRLRRNRDRFKQAALMLDLDGSRQALKELAGGAQDVLRGLATNDRDETIQGDPR